MRYLAQLLILLTVILFPTAQALASPGTQTDQTVPIVIAPGDTWAALAMRYQVTPASLQRLNGHLNSAREPTIGATLVAPVTETMSSGRLLRTADGGLLSTAATSRSNPWSIALASGLASPYQPGLHQPLLVPGAMGFPRDLPAMLTELELSSVPAQPGMAVGFRGMLKSGGGEIAADLEGAPVGVAANGTHLVGLVGTGAFTAAGDLELRISGDAAPVWSQPWRFVSRQWTFQDLTLTGAAAAIDAEAIAAERERLRAIWGMLTPRAQWQAHFSEPINNYLEISADYGGRRSYNGGPYRSYHEGVDFSAYQGTPVLAPAHGTVVLAENLFVRGGAVILDHGLGVYTGYYHLSAVHAIPGQVVQPGDLLGEVGTTGLSTGNHLHWDLLINGVWVDASAWLEQDMACWSLAGLGTPCRGPAP